MVFLKLLSLIPAGENVRVAVGTTLLLGLSALPFVTGEPTH